MALKNIKLTYLYRDAGNYKAWGTVIFTNPDGLTLDEIERRLRICLFDEVLFVAAQVSIPEVFLFHEYPYSEDDHFYHELDAITFTAEPATDWEGRSVGEFIEQCGVASRNGWRPYTQTGHFICPMEIRGIMAKRKKRESFLRRVKRNWQEEKTK